ncbi:hypothetical protein MK079_05260 [Candidatus Gracilibacteria bacterium]|nr:hypothetical protein [Candidatus Gracilibacteria bacterium]
MKKQYIFVGMIGAILYILYLIASFSYREYQIQSHIEYISDLNNEIRDKIHLAENLIEYKSSKAYKNKILKEHQGMKNKGEKIVHITTEEVYKKYTQTAPLQIEEIELEEEVSSLVYSMSIFQKWIYFLFGKDIR